MPNRLLPTLEEFRGRYAEGWTPDDLEKDLRDLSAILDLQLICVWQGDREGSYDKMGLFDGDSDLYLVDGQAVRELPDQGRALLNFLLDGEGDANEISNLTSRPIRNERLADLNDLRFDPLFHRNFAWPR
jgi:hypothetical protein